jgi:hypothetical protein
MRVWTAHTRPQAAPVLVREGFSWWALIFGPFWLLARGAWLPALLGLLAAGVISRAPADRVAWLETGLAFAFGLFGRDLWRWSLAQRGFTLVHVVTAGSEDEAFARLLARRPDLIGAGVR